MSEAKFLVRLPLEDHNRLKAAAKAQGVSLNTWALGVLLAELDGGTQPKQAATVISSAPQRDITKAAPRTGYVDLSGLKSTPTTERHPKTGHRLGCMCDLCKPPKKATVTA